MAKQSLLFKILRATHANGTHHKLALDALAHLRGPDAEKWRRVFLNDAASYMEGSKAPDKEFKDFTNHVLHVRDGYWGGAAEKTTSWYGHTVEALQARNWKEAAFAAGVMSHYYTDPIMPFHTAQSEAENNIHRAAEWSISKSYDDLHKLAQREFPIPDVPIEDRDDWVADLVCDAAEISNTFYDKLISNYDLDRGVVDPVTGLNERARRIVAQLISYAQVGQARILDRAIAEAGVEPPEVSLTAETVLATLQIPVKWVLRKIDDAEDRAAVTAMYDELQSNGSVEKHLSEDDRVVRAAFRRDVGEKTTSPRPSFRPPHVGGAFDYASALKARAAEDIAPVETPVPTRDANSGVDANASTSDHSAVADAAPEPKAKSKASEPKPELKAKSKSRKIAPADETASDESEAVVAKREAQPVAPEQRASKTEPVVEQAANAANKSKPAKHQPRFPQLSRNTDAVDEAAGTVDEATDDTFDAAVLLRDRAAEMNAADIAANPPAPSGDFRLRFEDEVEDGPSVGPKTALRLNKIGIVTVQDLLDADPQETADAVDVSYIRARTVTDWQDQARLQCQVPGLSGTASQLIVGAGVRSAAELAKQQADTLTRAVAEFADGSEGQRLLRDRAAPDQAKIARWIANAAFAATGKAA